MRHRWVNTTRSLVVVVVVVVVMVVVCVYVCGSVCVCVCVCVWGGGGGGGGGGYELTYLRPNFSAGLGNPCLVIRPQWSKTIFDFVPKQSVNTVIKKLMKLEGISFKRHSCCTIFGFIDFLPRHPSSVLNGDIEVTVPLPNWVWCIIQCNTWTHADWDLRKIK